jgi:hypothetical protein
LVCRPKGNNKLVGAAKISPQNSEPPRERIIAFLDRREIVDKGQGCQGTLLQLRQGFVILFWLFSWSTVPKKNLKLTGAAEFTPHSSHFHSGTNNNIFRLL